MYALVMNRDDAATWDRGMVVEFRPDNRPPGKRECPPRFLVVQLPEDLPKSIQDEWVDCIHGEESQGRFLSIVTPHAESITLARRKRKLDIDKLLQGRTTIEERVRVTLQEMRDCSIGVNRYKIVDGEAREHRPWQLPTL